MELTEKDEEKREENIRMLIKKSSSREELEIISQWKTFCNKKFLNQDSKGKKQLPYVYLH